MHRAARALAWRPIKRAAAGRRTLDLGVAGAAEPDAEDEPDEDRHDGRGPEDAVQVVVAELQRTRLGGRQLEQAVGLHAAIGLS